MSLLPKYIRKFFWGDSPKDLSLGANSKYISQTLLNKGDLPAIRWLFKKQTKKQLKKNISSKMDKKSRNFWGVYFG
jgi:hypothetical protein